MATETAVIGTAEACKILGISRSTLKRWIDAGEIETAGKLPAETGSYLFTRAEVERLAAAKTEAAAS